LGEFFLGSVIENSLQSAVHLPRWLRIQTKTFADLAKSLTPSTLSICRSGIFV
jgi:hypothetical protein